MSAKRGINLEEVVPNSTALAMCMSTHLSVNHAVIQAQRKLKLQKKENEVFIKNEIYFAGAIPSRTEVCVFFFFLEVYKGKKDPENEDGEFLNWILFVSETYLLHKKSRQVKQNTRELVRQLQHYGFCSTQHQVSYESKEKLGRQKSKIAD